MNHPKLNQYPSALKPYKVKNDRLFYFTLFTIFGFYLILIQALVIADISFIDLNSIKAFFSDKTIMHSLKLSLVSCTITSIFCVWVAVPAGYILSRYEFKGKAFVDSVIDIPIMLPPLVIGVSLLIFFTSPFMQGLDAICLYFINTYHQIMNQQTLETFTLNPAFKPASIIIAQFTVACAFSIRTMKTTFDEINIRQEQVALTLGCNKAQAFWKIVIPNAKKGIITAATLAWARSLGEFGPILIFSGSTSMKTEVLSTTVFLNFSLGNVEMATTVSLAMIIAAVIIMILMRTFGNRNAKRRTT